MVKETSQFNENFIKNHDEETDKWYFLEIDVQYLEKLHKLHNDWPFFSERMKIGKFEANLRDKTEYVIHITLIKQETSIEQTLNHRLAKYLAKTIY